MPPVFSLLLSIVGVALCVLSRAPFVLAGNTVEDTGSSTKPSEGVRPSGSATTHPGVRPVPSNAELAVARTLLQADFATQLADTSLAGRRRLARALLDEAPKRSGKSADQYALLQGALNAAREGSSLRLCIEAADSLAKTYNVDALRIKSDAAFAIALKADTVPGTDDNVQAALALVEQFVDADDFASALKLCGIIKPLIHAPSDLAMQLAGRAYDIRDIGDLVLQLRAKPQDPTLNLAVGRYYCLQKDQWKKGLPLLAKGSDAALAKAATDEIAGSSAAAKASRVGNEWWTMAEISAEPVKGKLRQHAATLYKAALPESTGLARTLMVKRIAEASAPQPPPEAGRKIALVADPLDSAKRVVFVLDATGSMSSDYPAMCAMAFDKVSALHAPQRFDILFLNDKNPRPLAPDLLAATDENKRKCRDYMDSMLPRGNTDAAPAIKSAFDLKPDLIYFMIDPTDFAKKDIQAIFALARARSGGKIPIHVIAFEQDEEGRIFCQSLADMTGGTYQFVDPRNR